MNFLAHIYLSGNDDNIKIGNFIGDFVKGNLDNAKNAQFPKPIIRGVDLHRKIDFFTDSHPIVRQSIDRLQPKYHKFSGIVIDMFYDYILATNFSRYSSIPLSTYSQSFYQLIQERKDDIPIEMGRMVNSMIKRDWLTSYSTFEGIEWSLRGIAQRLSFPSGIENATVELKNDYALYQSEFFDFFPQLITHCQVTLAEQNNA